MRCPSTKRLCAAFKNLSVKDANLIRRLAHFVDESEKLERLVNASCPATAAYVRSMHNSPYDSHMWRVTVALHAMDTVMGTNGVEGLGPSGDRAPYAPPYEFLSMGDPYVNTLIYRRKTDSLSIGGYGDIVERYGRSWP